MTTQAMTFDPPRSAAYGIIEKRGIAELDEAYLVRTLEGRQPDHIFYDERAPDKITVAYELTDEAVRSAELYAIARDGMVVALLSKGMVAKNLRGQWSPVPGSRAGKPHKVDPPTLAAPAPAKRSSAGGKVAVKFPPLALPSAPSVDEHRRVSDIGIAMNEDALARQRERNAARASRPDYEADPITPSLASLASLASPMAMTGAAGAVAVAIILEPLAMAPNIKIVVPDDPTLPIREEFTVNIPLDLAALGIAVAETELAYGHAKESYERIAVMFDAAVVAADAAWAAVEAARAAVTAAVKASVAAAGKRLS